MTSGRVARGARRRHELEGAICSVGFSSGHRFVVGHWVRSPLGPMVDVMWASPDGERALVVADRRAAEFVGAVYHFDRVLVTPLRSTFDGRTLELAAGDLALCLRGGPGWRLPFGRLRLPWFTRWVEAPLAWAVLGVRTFGVSPTGVREWYRADEYRPVVDAAAALADADLGPWGRFELPAGFGFSEPPHRPSIVRVRPLLIDPSGRLDQVVAGGAGAACQPSDAEAPRRPTTHPIVAPHTTWASTIDVGLPGLSVSGCGMMPSAGTTPR